MWRNALFCFEGRLFLSLQQSHLNVIYGDSWRFIQFTGFAPKRCTALGTYFPLSISSLATSKSPDSSACKSKARGKLKASWNILNLKISKTQSNQSHTILTLKSGCDMTGSPRSLLAVDAVGHRCQQVRHKLEPRQRRFSAVQGIQRQTKSMEQSKSSKSSHLVLYWGYPRSEAKDGGINMFILLEKELGLCSTPDLMKTFHTAYKFKEFQDIEKKNAESKWLRNQGLVAKQGESFVHGRGISRHQSHLRCRFDLSGRRDVANLKCKTSRSCHGERPESAKAPSLVMLRL